jgi:hypothetical protein
MAAIVDPRRAKLMARVLFSDLVVYAADEIRIGLEKDDLLDRVAREIEQARVFYNHQVASSVPDRERIFHHALVDVLIYQNRQVATHIW